MMSLKARRQVEEVFSKDVVVGTYVAYYERVVGGAGSKAESRKLKAEMGCGDVQPADRV